MSTHARTNQYSTRGCEKCTGILISMPLLYSKVVGNAKITKNHDHTPVQTHTVYVGVGNARSMDAKSLKSTDRGQ